VPQSDASAFDAPTPPISQIIEAVLFIGAETTSASSLRPALSDIHERDLRRTVEALNAKYERQARPYRIEAHEGGWRMRLLPDYAAWVRERLRPDRGVKLGRPALEVLAAVAFRQPITRPAIETLTNADAGPPLRRLLRMKLIEQSNQETGEPAQFRTTPRFLEVFRINSPADLPTVEEG
jgi:segregation and condensation protein B